MKLVRLLFSALSGLCFAVVFVVTFSQVIQRYLFHLPMPWANDVIRIFFIYSVFFGMAVGVFNRSHLNIDVVISLCSRRWKAFFEFLSNAVVLCFLSVLLYYSWSYAAANLDQLMPYLPISMSWIYGVIPLTTFFMVLFLCGELLRQMKGLSGKANGAL